MKHTILPHDSHNRFYFDGNGRKCAFNDSGLDAFCLVTLPMTDKTTRGKHRHRCLKVHNTAGDFSVIRSVNSEVT